MKILFITYAKTGLNRGGLELQICKTAQALEDAGHEVILYSPWRNQLGEVDVCHMFAMDSSLLPYGLAAKQQGKPLVISPVFNCFAYNSLALQMRILASRCIPGSYEGLCGCNKLLRLASVIIPLNCEEKDSLHRCFGVDVSRCTVIPNGIEISYSGANAALAEKTFGGRDYILQVGSIEPRKNQLASIKAMRNLPYKLILVGKASNENVSYYDKCRRMASSNVVFAGHVNHDDPLLASLYAGAKTFILPSFSEVMPLTLYEAAVAGCHLIAGHSFPIARELSNNVARVNPRNVNALKTKIAETMALPGRSDAQQAAKRLPTWNAVAEQLIDIYKLLSVQ